MMPRTFLFLQGVATPFFKELGVAIRAKGHRTCRVNFCGGDSLFSDSHNSWRYNQPLAELPEWLGQKHDQYHFTDAVLFGDTRPVHKEALKFLRSQNIRIHVFEEGYLRPHWITLEQNGVNGYSSLLRKPADFWDAPTEIDTANIRNIHSSFTKRALHDIQYRLANAALKPFYRHYRTHRPVNALLEYAGWAKRLPAVRFWYRRKESKLIQKLVDSKTPYYLFPLQLDADSQIRTHSPYNSVYASIEHVVTSFAKHAPGDSLLVIKNHPLATGVINHWRQVDELCNRLNLHKRILFLQSGHLPTLLDHTAGTVLVNSTTGTSALFHGSPVCALGTAVFNLPGLTFQHGLDRFWTEGKAPGKRKFNNFRNLLIQHSQVNGDFYTKEGIRMAVEGSLKRMGITPVPAQPSDEETATTKPETSIYPTPAFNYGIKVAETGYQYKNTDP
ncbi:MAG: capsular biosynthesis protein [Thiolinea sp.]